MNENREKEILKYNKLLERYSISRKDINILKRAKDKLVKEYIFNTKIPKILDLELLNYKALLFYFKDSFIRRTLQLKYEHYINKNDLNSLQNIKKSTLETIFNSNSISIKSTYDNFPHLIGIKNSENSKNFINEFLEDIFYETKLLEDFKDHKGDENKIKTFSWIYSTLQSPTMILERDAIKSNSKFRSDLIFVKKIFNSKEYKYHIVGLGKIDNNYVIKSQFPISTEDEFNKKFNRRKKIYQIKRGRRS